MMKTNLAALALALCFGAALSTNAAAGDFTADFHTGHSMQCAACHVNGSPKAGDTVKKQVCQGCHSYETLARQTARVEPNPHYSHLGDVNCTDCHKGHRKSVNMCNDCHQFGLKVPH